MSLGLFAVASVLLRLGAAQNRFRRHARFRMTPQDNVKLQLCKGLSRGKLRNLDMNLRALPFLAAYVHFKLVAIEQA